MLIVGQLLVVGRYRWWARYYCWVGCYCLFCGFIDSVLLSLAQFYCWPIYCWSILLLFALIPYCSVIMCRITFMVATIASKRENKCCCSILVQCIIGCRFFAHPPLLPEKRICVCGGCGGRNITSINTNTFEKSIESPSTPSTGGDTTKILWQEAQVPRLSCINR